jgi:pimeloyl-ACP methyl ester carboxylesterase
MSSFPDTELPFHFGPHGQLFGMFHAGHDARKAVLLCPPLGQDQIRCHRLYRQLARTLAAEHIAVLRFDYYGTGDSAGDSVEVDWHRCTSDTVAAAAELRLRSGVDAVVAFGARLGGSVALAAAAAARFAGIVAWDPVLDGSVYVARLDALQAELRLDARRFVKPRREEDVAAQWQGFAIGDRLRQQLLALRPESAGVPTLIVDSLDHAVTPERPCLAASAVTVAPLQTATPWDDLHRLELAILSHPLIQAVTGRLRETA